MDIEELTLKDKVGKRINMRCIKRYLSGLTIKGYLSREVDGALVEGQWFLKKDIGKQAPDVDEHGTEIGYGCINKQIWNTIRILKEFTTKELAINAATEECPMNQNTVNQYISMLRKAGYLVAKGKRPCRGHQRLRLVPSMNTGPHAPSCEQFTQVRDNNRDEIVWSGGDEA